MAYSLNRCSHTDFFVVFTTARIRCPIRLAHLTAEQAALTFEAPVDCHHKISLEAWCGAHDHPNQQNLPARSFSYQQPERVTFN